MTRRVEVTVTHLEMAAPEQVTEGKPAPAGLSTRREELPAAADVLRDAYHRVGTPWQWYERMGWDRDAWAALLAEPGVECWTVRHEAEPDALVGFVLIVPRGEDREIQYFGLVPEWIGRGVGGWFLTEALRLAWATGPRRVVLNTCSLDGPAALPNYLARGLTIEREERTWRTLPD